MEVLLLLLFCLPMYLVIMSIWIWDSHVRWFLAKARFSQLSATSSYGEKKCVRNSPGIGWFSEPSAIKNNGMGRNGLNIV